MPRPIDSISQVPYAIGYSFRNPKVVLPVTQRKERPYFAVDWAAQGPAEVKEDLYNQGGLKRFPTVWRRAAKTMTIEKLGDKVLSRKELPGFDELGEAPGPTDKVTSTSTVGRDWWGSLTNLITTAGDVIGQRQQLEIARVQAQAQAQRTPTMLPTFFTPQSGESGMGTIGWVVLLGGVGAAAYYFAKR